MALFNVSVLATLALPDWLRQAVLKLLVTQERTAAAQERQAGALEALLAKINEAEPDDPQPAIDALVARLAQSNTTLAEEVAKILAVHPSPPEQGA